MQVKEYEELSLVFGAWVYGEVFWCKLKILTKEGWLEEANNSL